MTILARCAALLALLLLIGAAPAAAASPKKKECLTRQFRDYNALKAGSARVLYARGGRKAAARVAGFVRETYPKFKDILRRVPPSDARERCFHGPNGMLDVYVTKAKRVGSLKLPENVLAFVHPYVRKEPCLPKKPVFAVVRPDVRPAVLAHELWHAFQAAYKTKQGCHLYAEWNEAVATWAGNFAYPDDDVEHDHDDVLKTPDFPMQMMDSGYSAWVFPLYLTQQLGTDVIRAIEESREKHPYDVHIDKAIPGGFKERFPDFSVYAYNQTPLPGVPGIASTFAQWDDLATEPASVPSTVLAKGDNPLPMETLRVLSREYRQVLIDDPKLRKIEFHNPAAADPDLHVRALVRRGDGSWTSENWDGRTTVDFCRDDPDQDVREVILAYSNSSLDRKLQPATRFQAEESCSLRYRVLSASVQYQTNASADHILCGRQSGRISFSGSGGEQAAAHEIETARGQVQGSIEAKVTAGWSGHHLDGCKIGENGLVPCSVDMPPVTPRPDGTWPVSFSVHGGANDANWTLDWGFDDPSVGFMDASDPECFVYIWGYFDQEASRRQVPRETFLQTTPFTLTFEGSGTAPNTQNTNATINHEWHYSITLQRL
jgi:hypothetical protein